MGLPLLCNTSNTGGCSDASIGTNRKGICPAGWHVPSDANFKTLEIALGMTQVQADMINWRGTMEGSMLRVGGSSGLNMPLAGNFRAGGPFGDLNSLAYFWSSSQSDVLSAWDRSLVSSLGGVFRTSYPKAVGFSVRCIKD
jgi:uncharacterized protein (TIGR02145 family)